MSAAKTLNSSKNMNWRTDKPELDIVRSMGAIILDPASAPDNPTGAKWFFTPEQDAFKCEARWALAAGLVFINPPWGRSLRKWSKLICQEGEVIAKSESGAELICLAPHRLDTQWCRGMQRSATTVCVLPYRPFFLEQKEDGSWGRAQSFDKKRGKWVDTAVTVPCAFYYWGLRPDYFKETVLRVEPEATFIKVDR